ncbi:hypothetical protein PQR05_29605 [Paraburkholderia sediminicola]|uniref:hypothetical protein n=1 Tax=Paraburkholderia sediminicola TaxID=458836 RepID=UPI0038B881DB
MSSVRYELKRGVQLRAEDVSIVHEDAQPGRTAFTIMPPPAAKAVPANPKQAALDLKQAPRRPWENATPRVKTSIRLEMSEELHMKLSWIKDHVPNSAISAVCRRAVEAEVERILAVHDRPDVS